MYFVPVTLGSGATPIQKQIASVVPPAVTIQAMILGASAAIYYIGDSTVAGAGTGVPMPTTAQPFLIILPQNESALNEWFLAGTPAGIVPVIVIP